jgi:hypothetical protein
MTNDEKLAWLNEINAHLAQGGKLTFDNGVAFGGPSWDSSESDWAIVPLPRKAAIRVAYR